MNEDAVDVDVDVLIRAGEGTEDGWRERGVGGLIKGRHNGGRNTEYVLRLRYLKDRYGEMLKM